MGLTGASLCIDWYVSLIGLHLTWELLLSLGITTSECMQVALFCLQLEFDGRLLAIAYPVTPLGWALACRNYTWTIGELHKPIRLHGCCLTCVIDDVLAAARTGGQCICIMRTYVLLFSALGKMPEYTCSKWQISRANG